MEFKDEWIENVLKGGRANDGWYWMRYEWQSRGAIHVHGMIRMGQAPDTYKLAENAIAGHIISANNIQPFTLDDVEQISLGLASSQLLIEFYDSLVCTDAPIKYNEYLPPNHSLPIRKMPMKVKHSDVVDHEVDLIDLTMCLQRHICKPLLCLKTIHGQQQCKLKFPKNLEAETRVVISRTKRVDGSYTPYKLEIASKRVNDERITNHNTQQLKYWRANCDFSVLYDINRVVSYITKYASKAEVRSNVFNTAFICVFNDNNLDGLDTKVGLRKVMTKVLAERDVSLHECLHQLMGTLFYLF